LDGEEEERRRRKRQSEIQGRRGGESERERASEERKVVVWRGAKGMWPGVRWRVPLPVAFGGLFPFSCTFPFLVAGGWLDGGLRDSRQGRSGAGRGSQLNFAQPALLPRGSIPTPAASGPTRA